MARGVKTQWLDRRISPSGPFLALCLSREEFRDAVLHLNSADVPKWMNAGASATMHTFTHVDGGIVCIVCIEGAEGRNPIAVAGLLVHEAVHIWQQWCDEVGEKHPGTEQEAYAIQFIAQELMAEYARRVDGPVLP